MFSLIEAAGWPIWFLILASVAAVALIIERSIALRRSRVLPVSVLDEVTAMRSSGNPPQPEALNRLAVGSALGRVLAAGLKHEISGRARMKEAMEDAGRAAGHDLDRHLHALGTIATVAPLMGLFGTVIGMIEIFGSQSPSGSNPEQLAYGISVALYNTAFGILIAIPALIAYRHFRTRVEDYLAQIEQFAVRLSDRVGDNPARRVAATARAAASTGPASAARPGEASMPQQLELSPDTAGNPRPRA